MDEIDRLLAELERVQARLGWLPLGAIAPRARLAELAAHLQSDLHALLGGRPEDHLVTNE